MPLMSIGSSLTFLRIRRAAFKLENFQASKIRSSDEKRVADHLFPEYVVSY